MVGSTRRDITPVLIGIGGCASRRGRFGCPTLNPALCKQRDTWVDHKQGWQCYELKHKYRSLIQVTKHSDNLCTACSNIKCLCLADIACEQDEVCFDFVGMDFRMQKPWWQGRLCIDIESLLHRVLQFCRASPFERPFPQLLAIFRIAVGPQCHGIPVSRHVAGIRIGQNR